MKRDRAKELLPIMQAYADGKQIQYRVVNQNDWHDVDDEDGINEGLRYEYRIKPELKYRPFKDCDELLKTFINLWKIESPNIKFTQPLIWLKKKDTTVSMITDYKYDILDDELLCSWVTLGGENYNMQMLLEEYTFLDGSPCGVCE